MKRTLHSVSKVVAAIILTFSLTDAIYFEGFEDAVNQVVVSDNLVLWLDGTDVTNSPQTSVWLDKSPNANNATLNSFDYTDVSGSNGHGGVNFDGNNDYATIGKADVEDTNWTLCFRLSLLSRPVASCNVFTSANDIWKYRLFTETGIVRITQTAVEDYTSTYHVPLYDVVDIVFRRYPDKIELFANGVLVYTFFIRNAPMPMNKISDSGSVPIVLYRVLEYDRALTNAEIAQNLSAPGDYAAPYNPIQKANAIAPLSISTYDGSNQLVHPSLKYFKNGWNGYKYWLAYSPYPNSDARYENPCIAVSNDLTTWTTPAEFSNPLAQLTTEQYAANNVYYSDPTLVYRSDINRLECWYRFAGTSSKVISRRYSTDGVTWSTQEDLITLDTGDIISPAIIYESGKYKMWYSGIQYMESVDGTTWTPPVTCTLTLPATYTVWHLDVTNVNGKYEALVCCRINNNSDTGYLFSATSTDGLMFGTAHLILAKSTLERFDNRIIYRASSVIVDGVYRLIYSASSKKGVWKCGLTSGKSLDQLVGTQ